MSRTIGKRESEAECLHGVKATVTQINREQCKFSPEKVEISERNLKKFVFDTYFMEQKTSHVEMDCERLQVVYNRFSDIIPTVPFLFDYPTFEQMYQFLESRCMPKGRECLPEYLECCGLKEYNPYKIVQVTHGVMWEDFLWLKFPGEEITWKEVKVRD